MSWSGNGGFFGPATSPAPGFQLRPAVQAAPATPRQAARDAYATGHLDQATALQAQIMAAGRPEPDDILFMGLLHHAAGRAADAVATLRQGLVLYPRHASMQENIAVLLLALGDPGGAVGFAQAALAAGSDSPNLLDCLAEAQQRLGRPDLAIEAGRAALEAKDRRFGSAAPLAAIPPAPPKPFDPNAAEANIIAYALWGSSPRYAVPLLESARIQPHLFPGWTIRVYHDHTVDPACLKELAARGAQLRAMALPQGVPAHRALLWRFEVMGDPAVQRFLVRDADSMLTVKERVAVDAWLQSDRYFHVMRDWFTHTDLMLAGMWGGVGGILPPPATLLRAYSNWRVETNHIDQDLLSETAWPVVRQSVLIHDSIFQPCLGSVPFPPFGSLPPGQHIGQNAFLLFSKTG